MDFQLKTLTTAQAANEKTDALIVLVAEQPGETQPRPRPATRWRR